MIPRAGRAGTPGAALLLALTAVAAPPALAAQDTEVVFQTHSGSVYKVEVLEERSSTPYSIGTAFVAGPGGLLLTNYHVVNDAVFSPDRFVIRLRDANGVEQAGVAVVAVDPAHDLAVLRAESVDSAPLALADELPPVGTRVYSLGFPRDLTGTVVEGSFGGAMENSLLGQYHFTGSLNPGMSGGPTLRADGGVIGVNVATSGNQLSYLVPASHARALLARAGDDDQATTDHLLAQASASLEGVQDRFREAFLEEEMATTPTMGFQLPTPAGDLFDCSATPLDDEDIDYTGVLFRCDLDDAVFLDPDDALPLLSVEHVVLSSDTLLPGQFAAYLTQWHQPVWPSEAPASDWATDFVCDGRNVMNEQGVKLRAVQCWRRRPDLEGLYDVFLRATTLDRTTSALVSTYLMYGATRANGEAFMTRALAATGVDR